MTEWYGLVAGPARLAAESLVNGTLQGVVLAGIVALALSLLRRADPAVRFGVAFVALIVVGALPALHAVRAVTAPAVYAAASGVAASAEAAGNGEAPASRAAVSPGEPRLDADAALPPPSSTLRLPDGEWVLYLLGAILLIATVRLAGLARSLYRWRRVKAASLPLPPAEAAALQPLVSAHARRRPVGLRASQRLATPVAVGFRRPAVLLPVRLLRELSRDDLAQLVLHEVAHLRRYDDWTNLVQRLLAALFFFNPAVHWLGRRLELERELACDARAATLAGRRGYARSLLRIATLTATTRGAPALGVTGHSSQLGRRIAVLMRPAGPRSAHGRTFACAAAIPLLVGGGALVGSLPRLVLAAPSGAAVAVSAASRPLSSRMPHLPAGLPPSGAAIPRVDTVEPRQGRVTPPGPAASDPAADLPEAAGAPPEPSALPIPRPRLAQGRDAASASCPGAPYGDEGTVCSAAVSAHPRAVAIPQSIAARPAVEVAHEAEPTSGSRDGRSGAPALRVRIRAPLVDPAASSGSAMTGLAAAPFGASGWAHRATTPGGRGIGRGARLPQPTGGRPLASPPW